MAMKNILHQAIILLALLACSCGDFLEEASQDLVRPVTVTHYTELLQGEGYFKDFLRTGWFVETMTDNFEVMDGKGSYINSYAKEFSQAFKWQADLELQTNDTKFKDKFFMHMYENILIANTCLAALPEMEGSAGEKDVLEGQAAFTRAYAYFCLANLYAPPYNEADPTDLCVPVITDPTATTAKHERKTVTEVWKLIREDIDVAVDKLSGDEIARSVFEINYDAALIFATRVYLYTGEYEKVITLGERFNERADQLYDITAVEGTPDFYGDGPKPFFSRNLNPEIKLVFGAVTSHGKATTFDYYSFFVGSMNYYTRKNILSGASRELRESYAMDLVGEQTDKRLTYWLSVPEAMANWCNPMSVPVKYTGYNGKHTQCMRAPEVLLNLAEAYLCKETPDPAKALACVNTLRRHRIRGHRDLSLADIGESSLLDLVKRERRRELCFEEFHRWWDLRRHGQPRIEHNWLDKELYVLEEKDPAYVLNFPREELDYNDKLQPNARPERVAKSIVQ